MEFVEEIKKNAEKIRKDRAYTTTEEATKTAFILPFFKALGYDTSDLTIFVPEFSAIFG